MTKVAAIILAAGHGTRMRSETPKVLHEVAHLPMLGHCLRTARTLGAENVSVVIGAGGEKVRKALETLDADAGVAVQDPPQGTGDAVTAALPLLEGFEGHVLVLYGDTPLITADTLGRLLAELDQGAEVAVLGFEPEDPGPYGRLITDESGALLRIVEAKDASPEELAVRLSNSGVMAMTSRALREHLPRITNDNAKGEYYLTDLVGLAGEAGGKLAALKGDEDEVLGVNNRVELAEAERLWQARARRSFMEEGVTLRDPDTVYFAYDTEIGTDCVIGQNVVFGPGVKLEPGVTVKPFSHLEGATMREGSDAGPFARLRPGADLGKGAHVGNFVEIKKSVLGEGVKVGHLTYLGDATIGARTNIGAGTITCNYDGFNKSKTEVGEDAFIGSNTMLVAPISVGKGAFTGSGSVITKNVTADALAVARGKQFEKAGWANSFRKKNNKGS
ncbi:bifunctional UDP-N-acetylglucosamine diphosphorylase/glucosamine-1-phosphate N-acetyltransferase GlmU [Parvularcula sp. ZS-1/3]|uniref:Bifunctional protein GlmU n=1 Tax=Parvularcula mediterranea TaxID=2732508 RepID=A0A7Y3RLL1_9PROT|nr:bifunctional UDP-N-acetylglucosamine diphosphorylase/glucosamine-1-phosphate N-acetyltransferase GlmU [Parvularcula mediterranea]NNU16249.1 bifunctional UDP-N-acetylglucosamine diphosphorylase/glucosamine-1-phosphate N-acetyltransferase GlmU [Parvularcula mediterranea]